MELAFSIALGIILVPIIIFGFLFLTGSSVAVGSNVADNTNNPLLGFIVGIGIFCVVIWVIVACAG